MQYQQSDYDAWMLRGSRNKIKRDFNIIEDATKMLSSGQIHGMIVSGPPGVGKTHIVSKVLRGSGIEPMPLSPASNAGLIEALYDAGDRVLFGDDTEQFINCGTVGTLKKALDPVPRNRMIVYQAKLNRKSDDQKPFDGEPFLFRGKLCLLMNPNPYRSEQWPKRLHAHLRALTSRVPVYTICDDLEVTWEYTCYLAICEGLLQRQGYSLSVANTALACLAETMHASEDASPRRLEHIARTIKLRPNDWRDALEASLPPAAQRRSGRLPPIPQIVPRSQWRAA